MAVASMLRDIDELFEGFNEIVEESKEECGDKLEEINKLPNAIADVFVESVMKTFLLEKEYKVRFFNSLAFTCLLELVRISGHIIFLSYNGLYRNAFDNIRYVLESIVQTLYIDHRHPQTPLQTKIEILKEVEDKREYHAVRLIDELKIDHKESLKSEYKKLSQIIHPSHKQIVTTLSDLQREDQGAPTRVDCEEIARIYDSMVRMYDIFFFLFITFFPEVKNELKKNSDFLEHVELYRLTLLAKVMKTVHP